MFVNVPRFLDVRAAGQKVMRPLRRFVRQNVADDERFQFAEQFGVNAVLRHVLAEHNQSFDFADFDAVGDHHQFDAHAGLADAGEPRAGLVRIPVRIQQQLVAFAETPDGIRERAKLGRQLFKQPQFLIGLPGRSDDGHRTVRRIFQLVRQFH